MVFAGMECSKTKALTSSQECFTTRNCKSCSAANMLFKYIYSSLSKTVLMLNNLFFSSDKCSAFTSLDSFGQPRMETLC